MSRGIILLGIVSIVIFGLIGLSQMDNPEITPIEISNFDSLKKISTISVTTTPIYAETFIDIPKANPLSNELHTEQIEPVNRGSNLAFGISPTVNDLSSISWSFTFSSDNFNAGTYGDNTVFYNTELLGKNYLQQLTAGPDNILGTTDDITQRLEIDLPVIDIVYSDSHELFYSVPTISKLSPGIDGILFTPDDIRYTMGGVAATDGFIVDSNNKLYAAFEQDFHNSFVYLVTAGSDGILGEGDDLVTKWTIPIPSSTSFRLSDIDVDSLGNIYLLDNTSTPVSRIIPGSDGIFGTSDDQLQTWNTSGVIHDIAVLSDNIFLAGGDPQMISPGSDGILGTSDDQLTTWTLSDNVTLLTVDESENVLFIGYPGSGSNHNLYRLTSGLDGIFGTSDDVLTKWNIVNLWDSIETPDGVITLVNSKRLVILE